MERLIGGLSSARAAARIGFASALTIVLSDSSQQWPADSLFKLIDGKLDLSKAVGVVDTKRRMKRQLEATLVISIEIWAF